MNEPQYYIAQGENVQGPYARSRVLGWIAEGRLRPEMMFSLEGGDWVQGHDCPELFDLGAPAGAPPAQSLPPAMPAAVPPARPARAAAAPAAVTPSRGGRRGARPRRAGGRRPAARSRARDDYDDDRGRGRGRPQGPPTSINIVVILNFIYACLCGAFATLLLLAAGSTRVGLIFAFVFGLFAAAYMALGFGIRAGSGVARVIQFIVSGLALLNGAHGLLTQGISFAALTGLGVNVVIIIMLLSADASAYFRLKAGGAPRGRGRARTASAPRRRRRR